MIIALCAAGAAAPARADGPPDYRPGAGRALTLRDRVWCQGRIEGVYYRHRLWPRENPAPKPPFEALVPSALVERKALAPLGMSAALRNYWGVEITPAMLQGELDRMERDSRDRAVLHELFAALLDDPFLIAETLVRGALAERILRERFAFDARIHEAGGRIAAALAANPGRSFADAGFTHARYRLAEAGDPAGGRDEATRIDAIEFAGLRRRLAAARGAAVREDAYGWTLERIVSDDGRVLDVESLFVAKRDFSEWYESLPEASADAPAPSIDAGIPVYRLPAPLAAAAFGCDSWTPTSIQSARGRTGHSAVWTGTEMILWGGDDGLGVVNTGARYNPSTDSWIWTTTGTNAPAARRRHTAVWTGSVMIVWGGEDGAGPLGSGARYSPASDTWVAASSGANLPAARSGHTAIWAGGVMVVWGGAGVGGPLNSGGRYVLATDSWSATSVGANVPAARTGHSAIWTGGVMIVWGGEGGAGFFASGGRYNISTDSWLPTSLGANCPTARRDQTAVWSGTEMIVWGGFDGFLFPSTGGRYNPSTDAWTATSLGTNLPDGRYHHSVVWTGAEMIVWGGDNGGYLDTGGRYNPSADTWTATSIGTGLPAARALHAAVWTGSLMLVWGGTNGSPLASGGRYNASGNSWSAVSALTPVPAGRAEHTLVWTGAEMIVWGGDTGLDVVTSSGGRYDPATGNWVPTTVGANVPSARKYHTAVWSGTRMIVWGGRNASVETATGGSYDPVSDRWTATSTGANLPAGRLNHSAIWTGTQMIVWGGSTKTGTRMNSGGRYDPAADSWTATSTGAGVPVARDFHRAVWTGSVMIVWGGQDTNSTDVNGGGRYNPVTDAWQATSTGAGVPSSRSRFAAVWTGTEMIVWGGSSISSGGNVNTGGRYNPVANTWTATSTGAGVPSARDTFVGVWTGRELLVWGGTEMVTPTNTGGRYNPMTDQWVATSTGAGVPAARQVPGGVWIGNAAIVWGGRLCGGNCYTGGVYGLDAPASPGSSLRAAKTSTLNLNWAGASGAASYSVKRCGGACMPGTVMATPSGTSYSEALTATTHFYAVEAVNACGATP